MVTLGNQVLPKEKNVQGMEPIRNISDYINRVNHYIKAWPVDSILLYRGEPEVYDKPCRPNIFRKDVMNGNLFFERSLFDAMRQNKLTGEKRYLDNAIDAQHGEFPSRLLDVSYNCLTALYFAVTPYYHKPVDSLDGRDGMVFVFSADDIFSPSAKNINDNYDAIINRDQAWFQGKALFRKNHKFIDHTKLNNRIIAQQGAFILFQGDEAEELPAYMCYGLRIDGKAKPQIRQELKRLFGIHTGSVYPEIINLVEDLSSKSKRLNTHEFSCSNEMNHALGQLEKELDYYLNYVLDLQELSSEEKNQVLIYIEHIVDSYRKGLLELIWADLDSKPGMLKKNDIEQAVAKYNRAVQAFSDKLYRYGMGVFSGQKLQILIERKRDREYGNNGTNHRADGDFQRPYQQDSGESGD